MEEKEIKKSVLAKMSSRIIGGIENFFYRFGYAIGCNPWRFILGGMVLVIVSGFGVLRFFQEQNPLKLWIPKNSDFVHDTEWLMGQFKEGYRLESILITAPNVLEPKVLQKLSEIQQQVVSISAKGITWDDVCFRMPVVDFNFKRRRRDTSNSLAITTEESTFQKEFEFDPGSLLGEDMYCRIVNNLDKACYEYSILELWKFDPDKINKLTQDKIIKALNRTKVSPVYGHPTNYLQLLGDIKRNETGHVIGASAVLSLFMAHIDFTKVNFDESGNRAGTADWANKHTLLWEKKYMELMENVTKNVEGMQIYWESARSFGDLSSATMFQDVDKLVIGVVLMFIYIQLVISKFNMMECRLILGGIGLLCIGMGFIVSVGICSLLGIPYGPVHTALPFLLMGIGVDDMFVIIACWKNLNIGKSQITVAEKMGRTMKHAGASITITTLTDVAAFLVGAMTVIPSLQSFCLYAATGLMMTYIFQCTIFVAAFVLDERRIEQNRNFLFVCYTHKNYKPNKFSDVEYLKRIFNTVYSKVILTTPGKCMVFLLTIGFVSFGIRGTMLLKQKFDPIWFIPQSSHYFKFFMERSEHFPDNGQVTAMYLGRLNYTEEMPNIHRLVTELKQQDAIINDLNEWYSSFRFYVKWKYDKDVASEPLTDQEFRNYLTKFLFNPSGSKFQKNFRFDGDLRCGEPAPDITVSSFDFKFKLFSGPEEALPAMNKLKRMLKDANFTTGDKLSTIWGRILANWYTDEVIERELYRNLALACFCVMVCTALLIVNFTACFAVFLCVLLTLVCVGGYLYFWGMTIDTVCCIALQLAAGLCVDYAAHVCHTFLSRTGNKHERVLDTMTEIGPAILSGGISTLIAISILALSDSYIFKSFFKIFSLVVTFGLFHGIVFLPVVLSIVGPNSYETAETSEPQSKTVKVYSLCDVEPSKVEPS